MVAVSKPRDNRKLPDSEILRAEDVFDRSGDQFFPPFVPSIVRAEDVMEHPDDPLPDPPKRVDMQQERNVRDPATMLEDWLEEKLKKAMLTTEAYLCWTTKPPGDTTMVWPDCMVGFGMTHSELQAFRNGWVVSELGYPPAFVLEVASASTGRTDYTYKREVYMRLRVPEIFRFDATGGRYHDAPLAGDRLVDGQYVPVPLFPCPEYAEDDAIHANVEALELDICWHDGVLGYYDPVGGVHLLNRVEARRARRAAEARANMEAARADSAETRAISAETRAISAETRAAEEAEARQAAESEARRLRKELKRLRGE